jgi:hypothetical protein
VVVERKAREGSLDCGAPTRLKWLGVDLSRSSYFCSYLQDFF